MKTNTKARQKLWYDTFVEYKKKEVTRMRICPNCGAIQQEEICYICNTKTENCSKNTAK
jgi:recombinational DNA repair protein RecR